MPPLALTPSKKTLMPFVSGMPIGPAAGPVSGVRMPRLIVLLLTPTSVFVPVEPLPQPASTSARAAMKVITPLIRRSRLVAINENPPRDKQIVKSAGGQAPQLQRYLLLAGPTQREAVFPPRLRAVSAQPQIGIQLRNWG